ncbi:DEAD/DEAH box helicase [Nocardioides lentus]|uniref:DEAD/DEAH box helicase n=1 Tax=Nocardioides lentus TaxID=338077 RepID=A0ABP5AGU3_9ACTN
MTPLAALAAELRDAGRGDDADALYDAFTGWVRTRDLEPYPHQEEAMIELFDARHVVLATPTGSGKTLVSTAAIFAALAAGERAWLTAPVKALVSEKFFELVGLLGPDNVGMLTGDASVNPDAPVVCATAEVLANVALREGAGADVGRVVMDEFHYYTEPDRGWAWQVPLLELTGAQFLLMSATLGDTTPITDALTRRTGRECAVVKDAERPVPLSFTWAMTPLAETVTELVEDDDAPVYVVHFTQAAAVQHATTLLKSQVASRERRDAIAERLAGFRFAAGFGKALAKLLRHGVGVHHAGMLPRYRRLVEQLAQAGLLVVVCGTDTLGVGINVPIRTVLFTALAKYDGRRERVLKVREFQQIAGRAGRAGYDVRGRVVVQAPEHVIENARMLAKAGDDPKKRRKVQRKKPPDGAVVWTEDTFTKLVEGTPEALVPRMKVDNAVLVNVAAREEDTTAVVRRLVYDNHDQRPRERARLARRAVRLVRSLVDTGVLTRLAEPDAYGRRFVLTVDLPEHFGLDQPLSHFALRALEVLPTADVDSDDVAARTHALDVLSVVEAIVATPRAILMAQQHAARGEAVARMKADGIEYEERMVLLEDVTWPQPLADLLGTVYEDYRLGHPWLPEDALEPASVVRDMVEQGMGFTDLVARYGLARSEGLVLRCLSDTYRTLRQVVPDAHRTEALADVEEWLGETIRQTDSSLLDEWEALTGLAPLADGEPGAPPPPPRPLSEQTRPFTVMVRNAVFRRVQLAARDDVAGLTALEVAAAESVPAGGAEVVMGEADWDAALGDYYDEHDEVRTDGDARGPDLFTVEPEGRTWRVRQSLLDPAGHRDWVLEATVDLDASDEVGEAVVLTTALRRL